MEPPGRDEVETLALQNKQIYESNTVMLLVYIFKKRGSSATDVAILPRAVSFVVEQKVIFNII